MIIFASWLLFVPAFAVDLGWYNDKLEDMTVGVQNHFQSVLSERYTRLYWDMYQSCNDTHRPQAVIHLHILNSPEEMEKDKMVHWEIKKAPCSINVYSTKDTVLQEWCQEKPGRMLTFPYQTTKTEFWTSDPNFMVVVQSTCHRFKAEVQPPRTLPLPSPFDIRQDRFIQFLIYLVPSIIILLFLIFSYYHCTAFYSYQKTRWTKYWERKEWEEIRDIIEYRQRLINEEKDKKTKEKYAQEQKLADETSINIEESTEK